MLSDRTYMRNAYQPPATSILVWLLSSLIAGFVLQNLPRSWLVSNAFVRYFVLTIDSLPQGYFWTLATYTLLHEGVLHLLFNGLGLFLLGRELVALLGTRRFLAVYIAAAVAGGASWLAVHYFTGSSALMGASSCVFSLFILFACFYPNREFTFLLFFVLPVTIKPKYLAWILVGLDTLGLLFSELPGRIFDGGIAHSAHLGGMAAGWIYFRFFHANNGWDRAASIELPAWLSRRPKAIAPARPDPVILTRSATDLRAEVDRVLDKINSEGFGSLTDEEKRTLDEAKDLLSKH